MAFPVDKETWARWINKDLPTSERGSEIDAVVINAQRDFLERLQDILGLNFLGGFGSLKLRLDSMGDFKADGSVNMTGNLTIQKQFPKILLDDNVETKQGDIRIESSQIQIRGPAVSLRTDGTEKLGLTSTTMTLGVNTEIPYGDIEFEHKDKGIILRSPDNSRWRVQINDAGTLLTTKL